MAKDTNGATIKVGDKVGVIFKIESINEDAGTCVLNFSRPFGRTNIIVPTKETLLCMDTAKELAKFREETSTRPNYVDAH